MVYPFTEAQAEFIHRYAPGIDLREELSDEDFDRVYEIASDGMVGQFADDLIGSPTAQGALCESIMDVFALDQSDAEKPPPDQVYTWNGHEAIYRDEKEGGRHAPP